ncbi:RAN protein kinase [Pseudogymnoascus sp. 03VT05]|nr:RAN protein kinase [Pseudogymnoascus sp. 03VT05]
MSTRFNNRSQPTIAALQENAPHGDSSCFSDFFPSQKATDCTPQTVECPIVPFHAAPLPTPPQSPYGYNAPLAPVANNMRYFQQPVVHQQQQHFQHFPPTPPATPPPASTFDQAQFFDASQRLQFLHTLGSGAYGVVHLAKDVRTGIQYAVKVLNKFNANGLPLDARQQHFQQTEMQLHYEVSAHPNIVSLLRILDVADCTYVVMEYCPEGDLFLNITERGRYVGNDLAAKTVFLQILDAVAHCHRLGVYHRDLKPENILVSDGGSQVKLADFGLATTDSFSSDFGCGSTFYMSPECQDQSSGMPFYACAPNDIWSLGVILVNLTCGRNPWKSASTKDSTFRAYLADRQFLKSILPLSDELNEILNMVFEIDPSRRISLAELRHRVATCGSMISDASDTSTAPSEAGSSPDLDLQFEVMDEDHEDHHIASFDDYAPASAKDPWVAEPAFVAPYVPVDPVVPPASRVTAPKDHGIPQPHLQVQQQQRFLSPPPRSAPPRQQKSVHQLIARCVTPSLLNSFCPQGNQRGAPVRRAF